MTFGASACLVAVVAIAAAGCGGEGDDMTGTSSGGDRASIAVSPLVATPPQMTRFTLRITTKKSQRFVSLLIHEGRSGCGRTWVEEVERWEEPRGESILEDYVGPGSATVTDSSWYGQPAPYRVCGYFDDGLVATATFAVRPLNRVIVTGRGLGRWHLNERYVQRAGYEGQFPDTEPVPRCRRSFFEADRIDTYRDGVWLAWIRGRLASVRTRLRGDRAEDGFVIGTAAQRRVRRRHPQAQLRPPGRDADGGTLVVTKKSGTGVAELRYLFDRRGTLRALETAERRC